MSLVTLSNALMKMRIIGESNVPTLIMTTLISKDFPKTLHGCQKLWDVRKKKDHSRDNCF
jgi:hypothetical protein